MIGLKGREVAGKLLPFKTLVNKVVLGTDFRLIWSGKKLKFSVLITLKEIRRRL